MLCMAEHTSMAKNCFQLVIQLASATLLLIEVVQIGTLGLLGMRRGGGGGGGSYGISHAILQRHIPVSMPTHMFVYQTRKWLVYHSLCGVVQQTSLWWRHIMGHTTPPPPYPPKYVVRPMLCSQALRTYDNLPDALQTSFRLSRNMRLASSLVAICSAQQLLRNFQIKPMLSEHVTHCNLFVFVHCLQMSYLPYTHTLKTTQQVSMEPQIAVGNGHYCVLDSHHFDFEDLWQQHAKLLQDTIRHSVRHKDQKSVCAFALAINLTILSNRPRHHVRFVLIVLNFSPNKPILASTGMAHSLPRPLLAVKT